MTDILIADDEAPIGLLAPLMFFHLRGGGAVGISEHNKGVIVHGEPQNQEHFVGLVKQFLGLSLPAKQSAQFLEDLRRGFS